MKQHPRAKNKEKTLRIISQKESRMDTAHTVNLKRHSEQRSPEEITILTEKPEQKKKSLP